MPDDIKNVLVTGANQPLAQELIIKLSQLKKYQITANDVGELDVDITSHVSKYINGTLLNKKILNTSLAKEKTEVVFHLSSMPLPVSESQPEKAHIINVNLTSTLLEFFNKKAQAESRNIIFIFLSSTAVYGIPNIEIKQKTPSVDENSYNNPITMYGINKYYCEKLGTYFDRNYKILHPTEPQGQIDFRAVRMPGIISAINPTTDSTFTYQMIHTEAEGSTLELFVNLDTILPFIAMPDSVKALIQLSEASKERLTRNIYNIASYSMTVKNLSELISKVYPNTAISFNPDTAKESVVDSWPQALDDSFARTDWGWVPSLDIERTISEYLTPALSQER